MAWPETRPVTYDADKGYDEENEAWTTDGEIIAKSGGKNKQQLIAIGHETIYFGSD